MARSKYSRALKVVEEIKGKDILKPSTYRFLSQEERFSKLMHLYDSIENWKLEYKEVEKHKPRDIQTKLTAENAEDIINGVAYDDLLETTLSMHIANKIAHEGMMAKDTIIERFISEKVKNNELDKSLLEPEKLNILIKRISIIYDTINDKNSLATKVSKVELEKLGVTSKVLQELSGKGIEELNVLIRNSLYIKSYETDNVVDMLKDRDDRIRFYEKESVMLTDDISELGKRFIDSRKQKGKTDLKQLIPELRKIKKDRPRFAHYIALKMGATKQELDEIYEDTPKNTKKSSKRKANRKDSGYTR